MAWERRPHGSAEGSLTGGLSWPLSASASVYHPEMNARAPTHSQRLLEVGARLATPLRGEVEAADLVDRVQPRHIHLCAALGWLAEAAALALGARPLHARQAGHAAAMLSLLTKIDDQVIDHPTFHGGTPTDRATLRRRTAAFLQPTLTSMRGARATTPEPRCRFAARLGGRLRSLGPHADRLTTLWDECAAGWATQVDAVAVLSAAPPQVSGARVAAVTGDISARWLRMITLVGPLAASASRGLHRAELQAFDPWGAAIQRADALADLDKDLADGLVSSLPSWLLHARSPSAWRAAVQNPGEAHAQVALHAVDLPCVAPPPRAAAEALAGLGEVPGLLRWIHGFLLWRYAVHPACRSSLQARLAADAGGYADYVRGARAWQDHA